MLQAWFQELIFHCLLVNTMLLGIASGKPEIIDDVLFVVQFVKLEYLRTFVLITINEYTQLVLLKHVD